MRVERAEAEWQDGKTDDRESEVPSHSETTRFRRLAAGANFLARDRVNIAYDIPDW